MKKLKKDVRVEYTDDSAKPDAYTPRLYSAEELSLMGATAFDVGMKVFLTMGSDDAVFVTRERDVETGDMIYSFASYARYRPEKDEG